MKTTIALESSKQNGRCQASMEIANVPYKNQVLVNIIKNYKVRQNYLDKT